MTGNDDWSTPRRVGTPQRAAPPPRRRSRTPVVIAGLVVLALLIAYAVVAAVRTATFSPAEADRTIQVRGTALQPAWPDYGQAAIALGDGPVLASRGTQKPAATASTAKLITVLVILQKRPLKSGQDGPTITITAADVRNYERYVSVEGSVVPVSVGQQLTERDALEAILLPSANNIADTLAIWAFGSIDAYRSAATAWVKQHGLAHTRIGSDASGYAPDTVSTADDLARLGQLSMADPVVRAIVAQRTADIPGDGTVYNVDTLVGDDGIVGVKTGNSDQNGGVFVGAAVKRIDGRTVTVVTAISGAPSLDAALGDSRTLLLSLTKQVASKVVLRKGAQVGSYSTPEGTVRAVAAQDVRVVQFGPSTVPITVHLDDTGPGAAGRTVGTLTVPAHAGAPAQRVPVVLADVVHEPSYLHDLLHP